MSHQLFENTDILQENSSIQNIYQKMMKEFYPKVTSVNAQIALDLGLLYIFRHLDSKEDQEALVRFWKNTSPSKIVQLPKSEYHYRPYFDFVSLDKIMNGLYIETVLEQLTKFSNLSFYESCAILSDIERYYVVPLSEIDVRIIETIRKSIKDSQEYNNDLLAEKLSVRSNYISRRMGYLRNNADFRITGTLNFPRIGLNQYIVLLESSPQSRDKIPSLFSSPYTRTIRRCPNQRYDHIISLTLPKKVERDLFNYLIFLGNEEKIRSFYCDQVTTVSNNLDFTYYIYSKRPTVLSGNKPGFYIDWFKERILTIKNEGGKSVFHNFVLDGKKFPVSVSDLKLLTLYRRDLDSSIRYLSNSLALSWEYTNTTIARLKELLFPMVLLYFTGLNQTALFFFEQISPTQLESLQRVLVRMPQTFVYTFKNGGAIVTVDLMNGAHRLNDLICETIPGIKTAQFSLTSKRAGIFRIIPYKYFNEETQDWFYPDDFFLFNK